MPGWVKALVDDWLQAANLTAGGSIRTGGLGVRV